MLERMQIEMVMRTKKNKNYTVMGNYHLRDKELSLKAKGLLSIMLSLPDGWNFSTQGLTTLSSDGETAIRSALKELEQKGYLKRNKVRVNGKITDWEYVVYEQKQAVKSTDYESHVENVHVDSSRQLNTKEINTKEINTFSTSPCDAPIPAESVRNEKTKSLWDISREITGNDPFTFPCQPTSDSEKNSAAGIVKNKPLVKNLTDKEISLERAALLGKAYGMAIMNDAPFSMQCGTDHGVATLTMEGAFDCWLDNALYREDAREAYLGKFLEAWENICDNCADRFWMPVRGGDGYVWQNVIRKYAKEWNPGTPSERREAKAKEIFK
nr:MAG TPA: Dna polymerase B [Bacteriophage sp.]